MLPQTKLAPGVEGGEASANQEPEEPRMVYVGNLPWTARWQELKDHMKQIGTVEFCRIMTVDGTDFGRSRGMGYVRFSTEAEAKKAIETLNHTEFKEREITVDVWTGAKPRSPPMKGYGKGFFPMKGGGNFPMMKGGKGFGFKGFPKGWGKGWGKATQVHGDPATMVYVSNLPYSAEWQEVKDLMKNAGTVEFVKVLTEDGYDGGRSKGIACVRFATPEEAARAVQSVSGTEMQCGQKEPRIIHVDHWKSSPAAAQAPEAEP